MAAQHTPGPWEVRGIRQENGAITVIAGRIVIADVLNAASFGDFIVGAMRRGGGGFDTHDAKSQFANARLIATAPKLVAVLQEWDEPGACGCDTATCRETCLPARTRAVLAEATAA